MAVTRILAVLLHELLERGIAPVGQDVWDDSFEDDLLGLADCY